jgi:hypothetical protein
MHFECQPTFLCCEMIFLSQIEKGPGRGQSLVNISGANWRTAAFSTLVNLCMVIQHSGHKFPNFLLLFSLKLILCDDHSSYP